MSVSLVMPAKKLEMCFTISIIIKEISSVSTKQFLLVLNITNRTLAVPGMNDSITFTIFSEEEQERQDRTKRQDRTNGTNYHNFLV